MVPISPAWQEYYMELEPERRFRLLQQNLSQEEDDGANALRQRLFFLRHMEEGKSQPSVDRYLWACVNFVQVYGSSRLFKKSGKKEIEKFLEQSGYREALSVGDAGEAALHWEIRNAAKRYFKTCTGKEYRRSLFGLLSPGEADQKRQMCQDVWKMTLGLQRRFDMAGELELWTKAVHDEFVLTDPDALERLQELSRSMERG